MIFSLFKIYISNLFSLSTFFEDFKKGPKKIIKNILIILLILFCISSFIFFYIFQTASLYDQLKTVNKQSYLPLINFATSVMILFFFGFFTASTNYSNSSGEEQFLSMPLTPLDLFGAKYLLSVFSDVFFSLFIILVSSIVYGVKENLLLNPLFYLGVLINCVSVPVIVIFIIYFLLVEVLFIFPGLRDKKILTVLSIFFVLLFSFSFNFGNIYVQKNLLSSVDSYSNIFLDFIASSISGNIFADLFLVVITCIVLFVFIPLLAPVYIKTLNGFSDVKNKKSGKKKSSKIQKNSIFWALFVRDVKTILKEPAFFCNGPLFIFIFPLIILISVATGYFSGGKQGLIELYTVINIFFDSLNLEQLANLKYTISLIAAVIVVFVGNSSNIAVTSFSREGKFLSSLKAMPIDYIELMKAKFFHSLIYYFMADIVVSVLLLILKYLFKVPFGFVNTFAILFQMLILSTSASIFLIFIDMFVDLLNPKIEWENPVACFKQNINSLISIFISLIICAILIGIGLFIVPKNQIGLLILLIIFVIFGSISGKVFVKSGAKKMQEI